MKMFMSDRRQREACLEIMSPLPYTALQEAGRILREAEPVFTGHAETQGNYGWYYSADLMPSELKSDMADSLWCFLNA